MTLAPAPLRKVLPHGCAYPFFALLSGMYSADERGKQVRPVPSMP